MSTENKVEETKVEETTVEETTAEETTTETTSKSAKKRKTAQIEDMVEIELFYDGEKYKDPVQVGLNGKMYQIQRGKKVKVPRGVAEIIANSEKQDRNTKKMIQSLTEDFEGKREQLS